MDIRNLRYFYAITKHGTFSKAAEAMYVTQPALSQAIKLLEKDLHCSLFVRGRAIALTAAGERLREHCTRIFNLMEDVENDLAQIEKGLIGTIRMAVYESILLFLLPQIISAFSAKYPQVQFEFNIKASSMIEKAVSEGESHFGLMARKASSRKLEELILAKYPHNLFVASGRREEKAELFRELPLFLLGNWQREMLEGKTDLFTRFPHARILNPVNHVAVIRQLIAGGLGLAILPSYVKGKDLRILEEYPDIMVQVSMVRKPEGNILPAAQKFIEFLQQTLVGS